MTIKQQERNAKAHIRNYDRSTATSLSDVYGRFSTAKARAWEYCKDLCATSNGWGLKVISHNTNFFSAGFLFTDPETGVVRFMFIAPAYDIEVDYE